MSALKNLTGQGWPQQTNRGTQDDSTRRGTNWNTGIRGIPLDEFKNDGSDVKMSKAIYKVEDRGSSFFCEGTIELPDFRVVLYVDGEWIHEWEGFWTEQQATEKANLMNK